MELQHASLYVKPEQYEIVGFYLLGAMKQILGNAFTPSIHQAWAQAYQQLADVMMKREDQLLDGRPEWNDWRDFRINQKFQESSEITSFYLTPVDQKPLPTYLPGQYISIRTTVPNLDHVQARQYSLSDAPHSDYYRISVKKEMGLNPNDSDSETHPGWISNILHNDKKVGDVIQVSHPAGEFFLDPRENGKSSAPVVLISAGVGLTPDLSILNTLVSKDSKRKISWVHATRNSRAHAFKQHVLETTKGHENIQVHVFNKDPGDEDREGVDYQFKGRMSLNKLDTDHDLFIHDPTTEYYVCGPEKFMMDVGSTLNGWGVDRRRIKWEVFGAGELRTD